MTLCCLPEVATMQVDGQTQAAVNYDPLAIFSFLKRDFPPMNLMCDRAEMFEERIFDRTKVVFEYFGLPYDVGAGGANSPAARQ